MPSPASYLDTKVRLTDGMTVESSLASAIVDFDALCFSLFTTLDSTKTRAEMFTLNFFPLFLLFIKPLHDINGLWHYTGSFKTHDGVLADYVFYSEENGKVMEGREARRKL